MGFFRADSVALVPVTMVEASKIDVMKKPARKVVTSRALQKSFLHAEDWLRVHNASSVASLAHLPVAALWPGKQRKYLAWTELAKYFPDSRLGRYSIQQSRRCARGVAQLGPAKEAVCLNRCAIIKPAVSKNEPGYLLVSFESELQKIAETRSLEKLQDRYRIIFLPTWQPFYSEALGVLEARLETPFYLMPSAFAEDRLCAAYSPKCKYLPFHAASWVRASLYPKGQPKTIDLLMVANFSRHKRHWKLFEALASMPSSISAVVAGVALDGRDSKALLAEAELFGVADRVKIIERPTDLELRSLLGAARLFCAMTHKEGSYIAVVEALMADTPVAMLNSAIIGSKAYINADTGFLLESNAGLARQLGHALDCVGQMKPGDWARQFISAEVNCQHLNTALRESAAREGTSWTRDIEPFYCEHFEFRYFDGEAERRMEAAYRKLHGEFGVSIGRPVS